MMQEEGAIRGVNAGGWQISGEAEIGEVVGEEGREGRVEEFDVSFTWRS